MIDIVFSDSDINELVTEHNLQAAGAHNKHWRFDDAQRQHVIKSWCDVQACPGSGKTTLVAAKLLLLAKKWEEPHRGICVLTHTNVARDEIIARLYDHPAGFKLTSYPHFIGTIQEFVNKHLGFPFVRTKYDFKRFVEDSEGQLEVRRAQIPGHNINQVCQNLYQTCNKANYEDIKNYLGSLHYVNAQEDLRFIKQNNSPEISLAQSNSDRRMMLSSLKKALCDAGIFQYRDMYAFAEKLTSQNPELVPALRKRFPVVIIDEMQDTQKFQDTLLNQIFDDDSVFLQRLGDPDQAIFDSIGGEEPNETYNNKENLYEIKTTHRFGLDICEKIIGLSFNKLDQLLSERDPNRSDCLHTIFLYNDTSRTQVLDAFGDLVKKNNPIGDWQNVKAVGGVEGIGGHISRYWLNYDKNKSVGSPKPQKLIHILYLCVDKKEGHVSVNYGLLIQGVLDLLRKANVKTTNKKDKEVYFTKQSLVYWLKEHEKYSQFRKLMTAWLLVEESDAASWTGQIECLKTILNLDALNPEATEFLEFEDTFQPQAGERTRSNNIYSCPNGQSIEVGTIHSVKGETHDATLVLETQFHQNDLKEMLPYLIDAAKNVPNTVRKVEFMRKLYVAASRPRHLLCLALNSNHINATQITAMQDLGWAVASIL